MKKGSVELLLDRYHVGCLLTEARSWLRVYRPPFNLKGKTVLYVGAGCGETAAFYFEFGAEKVVCIGSDPSACSLLRGNAEGNCWNVEVFEEQFRLEHLDIPHDFLKMDIEGGEELLLLRRDPLGPCRIELHPTIIGLGMEKIIEKFGLVRASLPGTEVFGRDD